MNDQTEWKIRLVHELATADQARNRSNEGMARVCARRAAGVVIAEYLRQAGLQARKPSAIEQLRMFAALPEGSLPQINEKARTIAGHFLLHLDEEHHLPVDADLVAEARWLAEWLLNFKAE